VPDPCELSAVDALSAFRARALSPVELLEAVAARSARLEPHVNAFAETRFDLAVDAARAAERRYARGTARALEGLLVAAKEVLPLRGAVVTEGLSVFADRPAATRSAWAIERVVAAGGIVHARTTTSELCCMPMSHAGAWGVTRNPWNLDAGVGGSSGGSAAALAAGTATLALGTDVGGSIRVPAAFAGVVGYKPPYGRVALEPPGNLDHWQHVGPLARTVADAALLANVLAGPHPLDVASLPAAPPLALTPPPASGLRVAFCPLPGDYAVDPDVAAAARATAEAVREDGARVEEVDIGWRLEDVNGAMWGRGDPAPAREILARARDTLSPYTRVCLERSVALAATRSAAERAALEARIHAALAGVLERFDALIVPTVGARSFAAGEDYVERPLVVDGRPLEHFCDAALTPAFNVSSRCPVVAVPSGVSDEGVPTGVQVAARPYDDATALRVAAAIERVRPWRALAPAVAVARV
jgi:aspartyl-tRNA(Asn)/glutamyl-tRNA(Gln) amidotransferase subunit A